MSIVSIEEKKESDLPGLPLVEVIDFRVVLCTITSKVVRTRASKVTDFALVISAMEPVKLHVN